MIDILFYSEINDYFLDKVKLALVEPLLGEVAAGDWALGEHLFDKFFSRVFSLIDTLVFNKDVAESFYSLFYLLQIYLHWTRNHHLYHIAETFSHLSYVLQDLLVLLVNSQLLDRHDVLQHYHFAWRIYHSFLDCEGLETSHCLVFSQNGVDIAVRPEFIEQLLLILNVLFGSS